MAGEVRSWDERIRLITTARADLIKIEGLYRLAKNTQSRERVTGTNLAAIDIVLQGYLTAIAGVEVSLDTTLTKILDDPEFQTVPHVIKPGEIDDLHHLVFSPASGGTDAFIEARDSEDDAVDVHWDDFFAADDVIEIKRAEDAGNNLIVQLHAVTLNKLTIVGITATTITGSAFPAGLSPVIVSEVAFPDAFNFSANGYDTQAEIHWRRNAA